jgi:hypothetical protein
MFFRGRASLRKIEKIKIKNKNRDSDHLSNAENICVGSSGGHHI